MIFAPSLTAGDTAEDLLEDLLLSTGDGGGLDYYALAERDDIDWASEGRAVLSILREVEPETREPRRRAPAA